MRPCGFPALGSSVLLFGTSMVRQFCRLDKTPGFSIFNDLGGSAKLSSRVAEQGGAVSRVFSDLWDQAG